METTGSNKKRVQKSPSVVQFAQHLDDDQVKIINELFILFDEDKDGSLNKSELTNLMKELQVFLTSNDMDKLFQQLDLDGDGRVERKEFIRGLRLIQQSVKLNRDEPKMSSNNVQSTAQRVRLTASDHSVSFADFVSKLKDDEINRSKQLFDSCDVDNDGLIEKSELFILMNKLGFTMTREETDEFWDELIRKNPNKMTFEEFLYGVKWLHQGIAMAKEQKTATITLQQKYDMLLQYTKEVIESSCLLSNARCDMKDYKGATSILEALEYTTAIDLKEYVGDLFTEEAQRNLKEILTKLKQKK